MEPKMSEKQAVDFLEKMKRDEDFRESVLRIEDVETKMEYIHRLGFSFSIKELEIASTSMPEKET